jgi:hypothetical protein
MPQCRCFPRSRIFESRTRLRAVQPHRTAEWKSWLRLFFSLVVFVCIRTQIIIITLHHHHVRSYAFDADALEQDQTSV